MIKDGCLEGVDEVYGLHNIPIFQKGEIRVKPGVMMAAISGLKVKITGKGGHSSMPHLFNDVISAGSSIITNFH
jgi:metal-dependent amidase/aminoacylase/carboxypeptidase family protein